MGHKEGLKHEKGDFVWELWVMAELTVDFKLRGTGSECSPNVETQVSAFLPRYLTSSEELNRGEDAENLGCLRYPTRTQERGLIRHCDGLWLDTPPKQSLPLFPVRQCFLY